MLNEQMPQQVNTYHLTPNIKINRYVKTEDTER
jgi:hypothetical protein